MLGVRQPLIDLEPLSEPSALEHRQRAGLQPPGAHPQPHERSSLAGSTPDSGDDTGRQWAHLAGGEAAPPPAPPAFDPLGAVAHTSPSEGKQRHEAKQYVVTAARPAGGGTQLISLDGENGSPTTGVLGAPVAAASSAAVRTQLEDLLL